MANIDHSVATYALDTLLHPLGIPQLQPAVLAYMFPLLLGLALALAGFSVLCAALCLCPYRERLFCVALLCSKVNNHKGCMVWVWDVLGLRA